MLANNAEGYPLFYIWEGEAFCPECAGEQFPEHSDEEPDQTDICQAIQYEDQDLVCGYCQTKIEPAYPED